MSSLLAAIGDQSGLELIHVAIWEKLLFDEHEGAQDIFTLIIGKIGGMHIMSDFIIQHVLTSLMFALTVLLSSNCRALLILMPEYLEYADVDGLMKSEILDRPTQIWIIIRYG